MKFYCVQLILFVLTQTSKLTEARDEHFFEDEIIQPELFALASQSNLKENMLLEEIGFKVSKNFITRAKFFIESFLERIFIYLFIRLFVFLKKRKLTSMRKKR